MSFLYFPEAGTGFRLDQIQSFIVREDGVVVYFLDDERPVTMPNVTEHEFLDKLREAQRV